MNTQASGTRICKNCGNAFEGNYCNMCGEKVYGPHDRSVIYIAEEALHFITHFEGNFIRTVKTIFVQPGKLTLDYCDGIRKKYYKPVTMFFFLIVIYLVLPGVFPKGLDMEMKFHQGQFPYRAYATQKVEEKMAQRHVSYEVLSERFAHESHTVSKFMLFIVLPFCAIFLWMLYPRGRPIFDHFMLSTEVNAFFLSAFFMLLPVVLAIVSIVVAMVLIMFGFKADPTRPLGSEEAFVVIETILFIVFCTIAFHRFYGSSYIVSGIKAFIFVLLQYIVVFFLYKFLLFATVMFLL